MLTTPHALTGLVIISRFPNIWGLFLAFLSHFVFDFCLPHWNPHIYTEIKKLKKISSTSLTIIFIDALLGVSLTLFFMARALPNLTFAFLLGMGPLMAVLPDLIEIPFYFLKSKNPLLKKYVQFEHDHQANAGIFWGNLTQTLVALACLKVLLVI